MVKQNFNFVQFRQFSNDQKPEEETKEPEQAKDEPKKE
jgi:nitrite reductase/ring-hydroxylating ferredoxin subunit